MVVDIHFQKFHSTAALRKTIAKEKKKKVAVKAPRSERLTRAFIPPPTTSASERSNAAVAAAAAAAVAAAVLPVPSEPMAPPQPTPPTSRMPPPATAPREREGRPPATRGQQDLGPMVPPPFPPLSPGNYKNIIVFFLIKYTFV